MSGFYFIIVILVITGSLIKCFQPLILVFRLRRKSVQVWLFAFIVAGASGIPLQTNASHISGTNITYRWLSGNSFEITLTLYRDCSGIDAPAAAVINYKSAACGYNLNATLNPVSGTGHEITQPCLAAPTTCNGGSYPGIQEYVYKGTVSLPVRCADWVFSFALCCRNCAITTLLTNPPNCNGMPAMYVEARLNNLIAPTNSSPVFSNIPITFVCIGQSFNYNHGTFDVDGDSLVYSLIPPKASDTGVVTYTTGHSATQPLLSFPSMTINSSTGDISMSPAASEVTVMAVLVREYRNGVLIGSVIRDIQVWTRPCSNNLPSATGINGTSVFGIAGCAGNPINFSVYSHDDDAGQIVSMTWDNGIPGATFSVSGTPYPTGNFSWTPQVSDARAQPYAFTVVVQDNSCPVNAFRIYSYSVLVKPPTNVCPLALSLKVFFEGYYRGANSMIAVANPVAYPTVCDTVVVELHNSSPPYDLAGTASGIINTNGNGIFNFPSVTNSNSYYIVVKHRNSIETWSKTPVLVNSSLVGFDFTHQ